MQQSIQKNKIFEKTAAKIQKVKQNLKTKKK